MDDYWAYQHDCSRRLLDAVDYINRAAGYLHHDEPTWPGTDEQLSLAMAALHVARVHLAAARVAYTKSVHQAMVAHEHDVVDQAEEKSPDSGES